MPGRPAVFLDRDGTLHRELERAPRSVAEIELFPGVPEALARLSRAGFALVVVSNQSAVARGEVTLDELRRLHHELGSQLAAAGAPIERFYVCPHHPSEGSPPYLRTCACRKPAPGLLLRAIAELELDPERSWLIGDARRDLEAAHAAGVGAFLVQTGKGLRESQTLEAESSSAPRPRPRSVAGLIDLGSLARGRVRVAQVVPDLAAATTAILAVDQPPR